MKTVIEHGATLTHDMTGTPKHWIDEVSVSNGNGVKRTILLQAGYRYSHGYNANGLRYNVYTKCFPCHNH